MKDKSDAAHFPEKVSHNQRGGPAEDESPIGIIRVFSKTFFAAFISGVPFPGRKVKFCDNNCNFKKEDADHIDQQR